MPKAKPFPSMGLLPAQSSPASHHGTHSVNGIGSAPRAPAPLKFAAALAAQAFGQVQESPVANVFTNCRVAGENSWALCIDLTTLPAISEIPFTDEMKQLFVTEKAHPLYRVNPAGLLGKGSFGKVYTALHKLEGCLLAVKEIPIKSHGAHDSELEQLTREISMLSSLKHNNIVRYWGTCVRKTSIHICLEFCSGGAISSIISRWGPLDLPVLKKYSIQILHGLRYLHWNGVLHRDIKGGNILVKDHGQVKLADFGASKRIGEVVDLTPMNGCGMEESTLKGSVLWMAPEVIRSQLYSEASDIWSFGCTVIEMGSGQLPWHEKRFENREAAIYRIGSATDLPEVPRCLGNPLGHHFLHCGIAHAPEARASADLLLRHPWLYSVSPLFHGGTGSMLSSPVETSSHQYTPTVAGQSFQNANEDLMGSSVSGASAAGSDTSSFFNLYHAEDVPAGGHWDGAEFSRSVPPTARQAKLAAMVEAFAREAHQATNVPNAAPQPQLPVPSPNPELYRQPPSSPSLTTPNVSNGSSELPGVPKDRPNTALKGLPGQSKHARGASRTTEWLQQTCPSPGSYKPPPKVPSPFWLPASSPIPPPTLNLPLTSPLTPQGTDAFPRKSKPRSTMKTPHVRLPVTPKEPLGATPEFLSSSLGVGTKRPTDAVVIEKDPHIQLKAINGTSASPPDGPGPIHSADGPKNSTELVLKDIHHRTGIGTTGAEGSGMTEFSDDSGRGSDDVGGVEPCVYSDGSFWLSQGVCETYGHSRENGGPLCAMSLLLQSQQEGSDAPTPALALIWKMLVDGTSPKSNTRKQGVKVRRRKTPHGTFIGPTDPY